MQIKLITKNKEKTKYVLSVKAVDLYVLNSVRRSAISLVPTMAIETVEFRQNTSVLYDEIIAHRLGMIPLKTDLKHYEMIKKPEDEESLKCRVKFTLKAKGPKVVYSSDLKSEDPAVVPVYDNMPIVKLLKGQELVLEANAILGLGKDHIKWSPGIVFFKNKPIIEIKGNVNIELLKQKIPEDSAIKISGGKVSVDEEKLYTTNYFDAYANESIIDGVNVKIADDEYVLTVESFGQLSCQEIMVNAVDILKEKLDEFEDVLSKALNK